MKALETIRINDAATKKNKFDLSRTHLTTMDIGEIIPILHEELVPGDTINVGESIFSRMAPLAVPTYGKFNFKSATMFVPYYQVFEGAEAFFAGKTVAKGKTVKLPHFTKGQLFYLFINDAVSTSVSNPTSSAEYDFTQVLNNSTTPTVYYYKFTPRGKRLYKIFRSLGYQIPSIVSPNSSSTGAPNWAEKLNALPLLCFLKAYNDFMANSQRYDTSSLSSFLESIRLGQSITDVFTPADGNIVVNRDTVKNLLLNDILLMYENDYFTSCWQKPNAALSTSADNAAGLGYIGLDGYSNTSVVWNGNTVQTTLPTSGGSVLQQRALDFLRSFDNWVRRNNYAGSKDVDKIYARFGIKPEDFKAQYAHLINTSSTPIMVGDVTSLTDSKSDNGGAVLGDYAGKGIINGDTGYKYSADDFGMLITLAWISVKPFYADGYDRNVLKIDSLDWFNPEFDGLGANPISRQEVYSDRKVTDSSTWLKDSTIFGFNERYNEYKVGNRNQITGDFDLYEDMNAWHFNRTDFKSMGSKLVAQSVAFNAVRGEYNTDSQFNRIFNVEAETEEGYSNHFYITAEFNVEAYRPMKNMNEVPNLGVGDTVVSRNGNTLN